jgi:hypothetical protein
MKLRSIQWWRLHMMWGERRTSSQNPSFENWRQCLHMKWPRSNLWRLHFSGMYAALSSADNARPGTTCLNARHWYKKSSSQRRKTCKRVPFQGSFLPYAEWETACLRARLGEYCFMSYGKKNNITAWLVHSGKHNMRQGLRGGRTAVSKSGIPHGWEVPHSIGQWKRVKWRQL